jgi:hypothetical protein
MADASYAELRIEPTGSLLDTAQSIVAMLAQARACGTRCVLLDLRALAGVPTPSLGQRHELITAWARAAGGELVVAVVAPESLLDPERFGVFVAEAAGLRTEAFVDDRPARAWLERQSAQLAASPRTLAS